MRLSGRALPYRAVEFPMEMRTKKRTYTGNPEATIQVLGMEMPNTTFTGMWKLRFLAGSTDGSSVFIDTVEDMVNIFYDFLLSGQKIQFQWGPETREGVIVAFVPTWDRLQDCAWSIEMEWSSRNGDKAPRGAGGLLDFLSDVRAGLNGLQEILALRDLDIIDTYTRQINATFAEVAQTAFAIDDASRRIQGIAALPFRVLGQIASNTARLVESLKRLVRLTSEDPILAQTVSLATVPLMVQEGRRRDAARQANALMVSAIRNNSQLQRQARPREGVRLVVAPAGATYFYLSNKYYGTPDFAQFLKDLNGGDSMLVSPGLELRIPPRPAALVEKC